jgi:RNA polymerase sigma factor (sigma-70 family)
MRADTSTPLTSTAAFDAFYEAQYVRAVRLARLLVDSLAVSEEIAQDAFVELLLAWDRIDSPAAYLRVAVVSRARSWGRRRAIERRHEKSVSEEAGTSDADDPLVIREALRHLTPRQRAAIVLRFYEDLTELQIAEVLRCRPGTVKSLVSRGLATMKEYLDVD